MLNWASLADFLPFKFSLQGFVRRPLRLGMAWASVAREVPGINMNIKVVILCAHCRHFHKTFVPVFPISEIEI